jgi:hypothetical protein
MGDTAADVSVLAQEVSDPEDTLQLLGSETESMLLRIGPHETIIGLIWNKAGL